MSFLDYDGLVYVFSKIKALISSSISAIKAEDVGASPTDHKHSASDITSGTLGTARGGTGVTSNPSMLTNLGSTTAASVFAASPRPGVTGTLPIGNGGTGATKAADALTNLGAVNKAGDTMTGNLNIAKSSYPQVLLTHTDLGRTVYLQAGDNGEAWILNRLDANNRQALTLGFEDSSLLNSLRLIKVLGGVTNTYSILHTGNKPSGVYTGTDSTTTQTIDTGGSGDVILVQLTGSGGGMALVSKSGAICKRNNDNTIYGLPDTQAKFIGGVLTLATTDYCLNRAYGYNWQVL